MDLTAPNDDNRFSPHVERFYRGEILREPFAFGSWPSLSPANARSFVLAVQRNAAAHMHGMSRHELDEICVSQMPGSRWHRRPLKKRSGRSGLTRTRGCKVPN